MNRQNTLGRLALVGALAMLAAFAGQVYRWENRSSHNYYAERGRSCSSKSRRALTMPSATTVPTTDEVTVKFRAGVSLARQRAIISSFNDAVEDRIEAVNGMTFVYDFDEDVNAEDVAREYETLPEVEYAEADSVISLGDEDSYGRVIPAAEMNGENAMNENALPLGDAPNDPLFNEQWSLLNTGQNEGKARADIGALHAWEKTRGSEKIVVAVIDTGVDYTHEDLMNNMWLRPDSLAPYQDAELGLINDANGFDALYGAGDAMDQNGHGTHCAGIIGAVGNNGKGISGVNWNVQIMPLKFLDARGGGTTQGAIDSINYVIQRKKDGVNVRIISASWGSTARSRALEEVIRKAGDEGILFVAAAGNSSANADRNPHYPSGYALPNVIAVAALDRNDNLAGFSNYGAKSVHIAAPGREILSTWLKGDYREASGTSMATPEVAGVAALILSMQPDLTVAQLRARVLKSVDVLPQLNGKTVTGGRLCAAKAVGMED